MGHQRKRTTRPERTLWSILVVLSIVALAFVLLMSCASEKRDAVYLDAVVGVAEEHDALADSFLSALDALEQTESVTRLKTAIEESRGRVFEVIEVLEEDVRAAAATDATGELIRWLHEIEDWRSRAAND